MSGAETRVHTPAPGESEAQNRLPDSILSSEPKPLVQHRPHPSQSVWSPGGLSCAISRTVSVGSTQVVTCVEVCGSGGDVNAAGVMHLARRSSAKGGDSEASGDGDGVGMARSLLTSASGGKDMAAGSRTVILTLVVAVSVEGGGMTGCVPSGGETSSSVGITTAESAGATCSSSSSSYSSSSSSSASSPDESLSSSSPSSPPSIG
nr:hypothetical protein [Tanacetum cinerariifolium]